VKVKKSAKKERRESFRSSPPKNFKQYKMEENAAVNASYRSNNLALQKSKERMNLSSSRP